MMIVRTTQIDFTLITSTGPASEKIRSENNINNNIKHKA